LNRQKCFSRFATSWCPESEAAAQEVLALPIFPELTDGEVEMVASAVIAFFKK
jgi:dTDP-4-amino-4,6-dideoxygalactose transaminase